MAGVPGLERLQRGGAFAHLADDDPIRAHAQRVAHEIDDADRLGRATGQGGDDIRTLATISYDPLSRRTATRFGDGSHQLFDFKADGDLLRIRSIFPAAPSKNVSYQYAYDGAGNAIADFIDNVEYRSTNEHDANIKTYAQADGLNRYWSAGGKDLAYWWEGPMSGDSQFGYHYDEQNRLKLVTSGNGLYESLARDAMGQLYYRAHKPDAGNLSYNYITGDGIRPEVSFDNVITMANGAPAVGHGSRQYFLGPNPDERLAYRDIDDVVRYPHVDRLGSTIALADGASIQPFRYSSFGESEEPITGLSGPLSYGFRYTGQRISPFTRQYDYKARTYAPKLGRFLEPDPSGFTDGPNLYAYVLNDPVNNTDPTGMQCAGGDGRAACHVGNMNDGARETGIRNAGERQAGESVGKGLVAGVGLIPVGRGVELGAKAAAGPVSRLISRAFGRGGNRLSNSAPVCRGGTCSADSIRNGSGVTQDGAGRLQGVSVQSANGKNVQELTAGLPHKQVGVTSVGQVRAAGGEVTPSPVPGNPNHATMSGVSPQRAQELLTPTIRNPNVP